MGHFTVAQLIAGLCMVSLCAADYLFYQPELVDAYQPLLVRTRRQAAPHVNVHTIPKTSFSCEDKKLGEYYADMETRCQVYHICLNGVNGRLSPMSFVCPNGTIFSQANRVCTPFDRVYCQIQERFYENLHGDLNNRRTDYGSIDDYANLPYVPPVPRIRNNDITDEDSEDDEPATPRTPPRRQQRPSGRSRRPTTDAPPPPPPPPQPAVRRQFRPAPAVAAAPPPPPPPQPAVRRQPNFRPPTPVFDSDSDTTSPPQQPPRSAAPTVRRPVYRNQVRPTTTEEPETPATTQRSRRPSVARTPNVRVVAQPPVLPLIPQAPPVDLSNPEGFSYAQPPPRGPPSPAFRLPPGLRAIARPVFPESANENAASNTEIPQIPARPQPFQPAQPSVPRQTVPPTQPPTTQAPSEPNTTPAANNNNDYEYVYDYEFPPSSGNTRS